MRIIGRILIFLLLAALVFVGGWQLSKSRDMQVFGDMIKKVDTEEKVVALTFDDGPTKNTGRVLEVLEGLDVKATFYLTGREISENMDRAKAIVQAGHEVGNHTYSHPQMVLKTLSFVEKEVEDTNWLIREAGYEGPITFRPPYFKKLLMLPYYLSTQGTLTVLADVEPETSLGFKASASDLTQATVEAVEPGSIILLHVMYDSREEAVKALPEIVGKLRDRGYRFVTIGELLEYGSKTDMNELE